MRTTTCHARAQALIATVLALWLAAMPACSKKESKSGPSAGSSADSDTIKVIVPASASPEVRSAKATPIRDLEPLKKIKDGAGIVSAGKFEPSGLVIPQGLEVTWPLAGKMAPGSRLWIVVLDEPTQTWVATGNLSVVNPDGRSATGTVYHFSTIANSATNAEDQDENKPPPHGFTRVAKVTTDGHHTKTVDPAKKEAVKKLYLEWVKGVPGDSSKPGHGNDPIPLTVMQEIYRTGDFETVKTLIEEKVVSPEHSADMADHRILMILQTWEHIVNQSDGKQRVHRSDSGNQNAGMSSDVDQTIYIEEFRDGKWVRAENLDGKMVQEFKTRFEEMHKIKVESLDIATIAGRDKYPDWRKTTIQLDAEGKREFKIHAHETMFTLRRTPGAYTYCGAVVQQMQLRVLDAMEKQLRAGEAAPEVKEPRKIRVKELSAHNPDFKLNQLLFNTIEKDPKTGKAVAKEAFREDATRVMFDGVPPKLVAGHSYDAAVANYFEFMHHLNDKYPAVKYHLRSLDDGFNMLKRLKEGAKGRADYADVPLTDRAQRMKSIFGESLADAPKDLTGKNFLDRWQQAFDISAELRKLHSDKKLTDDTADEAFKTLAEELAPRDKKGQWKEYLPQARAEYNRRCQEFMVYNICETSQQRIGEFLSPNPDTPEQRAFLEKIVDEGSLRKSLKLEGKKNDAKWTGIREEFLKNYSEQARLQLLYSFREIGSSRPDIVEFIIKKAESEGRTPEQIRLLREVAAESKSMFFGYREFAKFPKTYLRYAQLSATAKVSKLANSVMDHLAGEYGFTDTPHAGPRPTDFFKSIGATEFHERLTVMMKENKLLGITDRTLGSMFLNIGAVQSGANVLRAYSESGGDRAELNKAIAHELVMMLPGIGQVVGSYEAGLNPAGQLMIWVPLLVPELGIVMAVYGISEAGVALYVSEYVRPLGNDIADALYRGYVGPSLYEFAQEGHPPEFTEEDQKKLDRAEAEVERYAKMIQEPDATKGTAQALAISGREKHLLSMKKSAWNGYLTEQHRYEGSAIIGTGKHKFQLELEVPPPPDPLFKDEPIGMPGSLLARVKPVIFYSRAYGEGPVDFTTKPLTDAQKTRLQDLEKQLNADGVDVTKWVDMEVEKAALSKQQKAYERAQRYLDSAKTNPDLMLQIRLDSLWPNIMTEEGVTKEGWARDYVAKWVAIRTDVLPDALKKVRVEVNDTVKPHTKAVLDSLGERLERDLQRSRQLWLINEITEKSRAKWEKEQIDKKKGALMAEAMALSAENPVLSLTPEMRKTLQDAGIDLNDGASLYALAQAFLERNIPESAPEISISMRRVPAVDTDESSEKTPAGSSSARPASADPKSDSDKKTKPAFEFHPDVKVTANPEIYKPPYSFFTYVLDPQSAKQAAGARSYRGLPLSDDMVKSLQEYLKDNPPQDNPDPENDKFVPAVITFVFCADVQIPPRVIPETIEGLPQLIAYDIPLPGGAAPSPAADLAPLDEDGKPAAASSRLRGYLFGGGAFAPAEKAVTGTCQIVSRRAKSGEQTGTYFEITSEALAKLDPKDFDNGVMFVIERAWSADGPWEPVVSHPVFSPRQYEQDERKDGPNKVTIGDGQTFRDRIAKKCADDPVFYRVSSQGAIRPKNSFTDLKTIRTSGKLEYSNVLPPGEPYIRVSTFIPPRDNKPFEWGDADQSIVNNSWSFTAQLALKNQEYDYAQTLYTVKMDDFTGHYYSPPVAIGQPAKVFYKPNSTWTMPTPARPTSIIIQAQAKNGASANRSISVTLEPAIAENHRKLVEQFQKDAATTKSNYEAKAKEIQARIDALKKENQFWDGVKDGFGFNEKSRWYINNANIEIAQSEIETNQQYLLPILIAQSDAYIAEHQGDWPALLKARRRTLELAKVRLDLVTKHAQAPLPWLQKNLDLLKKDGFNTADTEAAIKRYKTMLEEAPRNYEIDKVSAGRDLFYAAYFAGDASAFKQAANTVIEGYKNTNRPNEAAHFLLSSADYCFIVTGDQQAAAQMMSDGYQQIIAQSTGSTRETYEKIWTKDPKPTWWPSEPTEPPKK